MSERQMKYFRNKLFWKDDIRGNRGRPCHISARREPPGTSPTGPLETDRRSAATPRPPATDRQIDEALRRSDEGPTAIQEPASPSPRRLEARPSPPHLEARKDTSARARPRTTDVPDRRAPSGMKLPGPFFVIPESAQSYPGRQPPIRNGALNTAGCSADAHPENCRTGLGAPRSGAADRFPVSVTSPQPRRPRCRWRREGSPQPVVGMSGIDSRSAVALRPRPRCEPGARRPQKFGSYPTAPTSPPIDGGYARGGSAAVDGSGLEGIARLNGLEAARRTAVLAAGAVAWRRRRERPPNRGRAMTKASSPHNPASAGSRVAYRLGRSVIRWPEVLSGRRTRNAGRRAAIASLGRLGGPKIRL